jgi:Na+-translocating ferredoxin:NAD+ oxidoreductase subunit E
MSFTERLLPEQKYQFLLLGLCPMLAVTDTAVKAFSIGLASLLVLLLSSMAAFTLHSRLNGVTRLPALIIIVASVTMLLEMLMQVHAYPVYKALGLFVSLIAANPLILAFLIRQTDSRPDSSRQAVRRALAAGFAFLLMLVTIGISRELLATGAVLSDLHLIWSVPVEWKLSLIEDYRKYVFIRTAPCAFISLGFLLVLRNLFFSQSLKS